MLAFKKRLKNPLFSKLFFGPFQTICLRRPWSISNPRQVVTLHQMLKNSYNFFVLQHCILQRNILNVFRRVQTCPDMPFKTFKKPPNLDAVVTEAILNSPLLQRKRVVLEPSLDNNNTNNLNSPLVRRKRQQHQQRKKGLRKVISGMVSSFRNVITGIIPHTSANSTSHSPDNIPLIDYVTARGKNIFDTHTDIYL